MINKEKYFDKLKNIFDNIKVGIAMCNANNNQLEIVNTAFANLYGYEPHELIGLPNSKIFTPDCILKLEKHGKNPSNAINDITFETVHYKKDGSSIDVFVHITMLIDAKGDIKHRVANVRDITKEKREREKLQNSENKRKKIETQFASLGSIIPDIIWMKDIDGHYIYCNSAFESFFSTSKENIFGKNDYALFDKNVADPCKQTDMETISTETININQKTFINPDDKTSRIMEIRKIPLINDMKKVIGILGIGRDLTDHIKHQNQLIKMEFFLKHIKESIFLVTENGKFEYVNEQACKVLGYTKKELFSLCIKDIAKGFNADIWASHWEYMKTHGSQTIERVHIRKDGTYFPVEINANYFLLENKSYNLAIVRDISQKKRQEDLLLQKEKELNALSDNLPGFVYTYRLSSDKQEEFLYVSKGIIDVYGISPQNALKDINTVREIIHHEDIANFRASIIKSAQTLDAFNVEFRVNHPFKGKLWLESKAIPENPSPDGSIIWHGITVDITKRKKQEKALAQKEEEYRSLAENIPDNIARWDVKGRYLYINPTHERLLGMSLSEAIGNFIPDSHTEVKSAIAKVVATKEEVSIQQKVPRENGEIEIHDVSLVPEFDETGEVVSVLGIGRNITKQKRSEEHLQKTKAKLSAVISTIPDLVWVKDKNGVYMMCNPSFENFFGAKSDEIIGKTDYDFLSKEQADFFRQKDKEAMDAGEMRINEEEIVFAHNGQYALLETRKIPVYNGTEFMGVLGIGRDITERKVMEEQLFEQNQFLDSLLNAIPVPVFYKDKETRYKGFNKAFEEFYGKKKEELIGKGVFDIFPREQAQVFFDADADLFRNGGTQIYETKLRDTQGIDHDVMFHKAVYFDTAGTAVGLIGTILDITERKAKEEELLLQKFALNKINEAAYLIDENSMFHYVNEAACRDLGYSAEEFLTMGVIHIDPNVPIEWWEEHWKEIKKSGTTLGVTEHRRKDGTIFPVEVSSNYFEYNGMSYSLAIARDITDRKEIEEALKTSEQKFRTLIENATDNIIRYDKEARIIYINPQLEKVLDIPSELVLGTTPTEHRNYGICDQYEIELKKVIATGENAHTYITLPDIGNGEQYHYIQIVAERDVDGHIIGAIAFGRDVTELTNKTIELQKSLEFNEGVIAAIPDLLFEIAPDGTYVGVWAQNPELLVAQRDMLLGNDFKEILPPDVVITLLQTLKEVDEKGFSLGNTFSLELPDGKRWFELSVSKKKSSGNYIILSRDITERKRQEELLRQKEQEFRTLAENSPDVIVRYDSNLKRVYANPAYAKINNMPVDEVLGKTPEEKAGRIAPMATAFEAKLKEVIKTGQNAEMEITWQDEGNNAVWFNIRIVPEYDVSDKIIGALSLASDITEHKEHEKVLLKQEQEFRTLIENSPDIITRYDLECRRIYVNPRMQQLLGRSKEEILGKKPSDFSPLSKDIQIEEKILLVAKTGKEMLMEVDYVTPTGVQGYGHLRIVPEFDKEGQVVSILTIGHDITERKEMERMILAREYEFRTLAENSPNIIMRYNTKCERTYVNGAYIQQTGIPKEQAENSTPDKQWGVYIHMTSMNAQEYQERVLKVIQTGTQDQFIIAWHRLSDNVYVAHELHVVAEKDMHGNIIGALAIGHNITKHQELEENLNAALLKLEQFINNIPEVAWIRDDKYRFIMANKVIADQLKVDSIDDVLGKSIEDFFPSDKAKEYIKSDYIVLNEGITLRTEEVFVSENGEVSWTETIKNPFRNASGEIIGIIGTERDITERKIIEKQINHMAHHDALTGLPNRILATDKVEQALKLAKKNNTKMALLFLDLDEFKTINDSMGHSYGDEILKLVASRLQSVVRGGDSVCRQGGDEFLIILSDIQDTNCIIHIVEKILQEFEKQCDMGEYHFYTSASIGIAVYPEHGNSFETLFQNADTAMYKAKDTGKNTFSFFTEQMKHFLIGKFKLQNDLKKAILNNEFILHYQPQISRINGRIVGAEALIRWKHPQIGIIPPMDFIPIAESSGLIVKIGEWVIQEACKQAALWNKQGMNICIAVNISALQFKRGNFKEVIIEALSSSGLDPNFLELELTESIMINEADNILQVVKALKKLGIQLSIDDFGTGYSSLAYLKRFAIDKLKIDKSFIQDIVHDNDDAIIVKTIIQMAKNLNLKTVAEGVENQEVLAILDSYGCDEIQGYYFSRPLETTKFEEYYHKYNKQKNSYRDKYKN
ncbi:MAG: PAS domain S-box protein [Sulfurospirillaceae bacterium]|nr:PAS domain S-box protein [Sulfurospirillaceae bacterium]